MALTSGTRLGPYEITAQIGMGGMGKLYRAKVSRLLQPALLVLALGVVVSCQRGASSTPPTPFELEEATIASVQAALRGGSLTCRQVVTTYLERIEAYDESTGLNAIILVNPRALERAEALDDEWAATGAMRPLHCVPMIVKDNYDTADLPTTAGSLALEESIPPDDAYQVRVLREAGAIVLAKSNMAEWAFTPNSTISSIGGTTRNPYDLDRVPAGSSGGTAAAVAANFGLVGLGSDTGNSIRGPAAYASLVGIRSTIGATSRDGIVPLFLNRDIGGPMTRTVEDAARIFAVVAGYDPADPVTAAVQGRPPIDYLDVLDRDGLDGARIGVLRALIDTSTADADVRTLVGQAVADIASHGAVLIDPFEIPNLDTLREGVWCNVFRHDINAYLAGLGEGAPVKSLGEIVASGRFDPSVEQNLRTALAITESPENQDPPCVDVEGDPRRAVFRDAVLAAMDAAGLDAVVYPTWTNPPRLVGDSETPPPGNNSAVIAPHTGQPAIVVPMGVTSGNLPAGLELLGRPFAEAELFRLAYAYEQATRHRRAPGLFPVLRGDRDRER